MDWEPEEAIGYYQKQGAPRYALILWCIPYGNRLHFLPRLRKKIVVRLRQAVAGGARPHRI